jgi:hypothetical protein
MIPVNLSDLMQNPPADEKLEGGGEVFKVVSEDIID